MMRGAAAAKAARARNFTGGRGMTIIDSGVHVWLPEGPDRPWMPGRTAHLPEPLTYQKFGAMMEDAGVSAAILVPPSWEGERIDYSLEAAQKYPNRFAVMGRFPINQPEERERLETWRDQKGMLGVRLTLHHEWDRTWMSDGTADWFWPAAERLGIPVMLNAPYTHKEIGEVAARHPRLRIILDHLGARTLQKDDALRPQIESTARLAEHPNIHVKLTLVPVFSTAPYPYENIQPSIHRLLEAYGPRRCFWGTDASAMLQRTSCSYADCVELFTEHMDFMSKADLEWVMGRGLAECLDWPKKS
jgi:predicted TIM-barrel fold metal-dependent hydrolase